MTSPALPFPILDADFFAPRLSIPEHHRTLIPPFRTSSAYLRPSIAR